MCCLNNPNPSLTHIISQMLSIVTNFDHKNTKKSIYCFQAIFCLFYPLSGQNGYKCCLNTRNPSLTPMIIQMHWIMTHSDHRNTNKAIDCF
ncbi:hypothetical protein AtEden1_Chr1g0041361 [Arabidopsis thaliana]